MPLPDFRLISDDISILNGGYMQGHSFNLSSDQLKQGSSFKIIYLRNDALVWSDIELRGTNTDVLVTEFISDTDPYYIQCTFINAIESFDIDVNIWDNNLDDYTILFNLSRR